MIARILGINPKTVAKYRKINSLPKYPKRKKPTRIDQFLEYTKTVEELLVLRLTISAEEIYASITAKGYSGSLRTLRRRVKQIVSAKTNDDHAKAHRGNKKCKDTSCRHYWREQNSSLLFSQLDRPRISNGVGVVRAEDKATLEEWRTSNDKRLWQKAVTILDSRLLPLAELAKKIEQPRRKVRKWISTFNNKGIQGLNPDRKKRLPGSRGLLVVEKQKRILTILHDRPKSFEINRASWSLKALASAYRRQYGQEISDRSIGRLLNKSGYSMKRARRVLTSPDPEYRAKVELLLQTLRALKDGEYLFFIDEMGPLRIKKYGGRGFSHRSETLSFPQIQANKGSITMSAALSATMNQVTWLYAPAKDTQAMIDLIEVLFNQHPAASKIYLTWDAASWHSSMNLVEWLDEFNAETERSGNGPLIEIVPLPTSSQFLDVLEAVFSGMKRAVIHHSDYVDKCEMKSAISTHFNERNEFFNKNPRRAGKKIWELDFFQDIENLKSGDYREW